MRIEEINEQFRYFFRQLINDTFKKRNICALTLGVQSEPQFEGFMNGKDFGIKPLQRVVEGFEYDIQLILVKKDDKATQNGIRQHNLQFFDQCKTILVKNLSNPDLVKSSSTIKTGILAETANKIFEDLMK